MWCYVSQPNSVVFKVELDQKADGQELLDKVCEQLGILEVDYFGLQYTGSKNEQLWLNMRNRITHQIPGSAPYKLQLKVKFFVQPHLLLQPSSRNLVYLHLKQDFIEGKMKVVDGAQAVTIAALISQAEIGDFCYVSSPDAYSSIFGSAVGSEQFLVALSHEHAKFIGVSHETAQYRMLQVVSEFSDFGVEYHHAKYYEGKGEVVIGVGPEGIILHDTTKPSLTDRIEYPTIQVATHAGRNFFITIIDHQGEMCDLGFRLVSCQAANGLYRCVTEKHSFYRCDTVRNAVSAQFSRDLKGTLASIFNENTNLGKKYMFDIRRTCREVCDHARRKLYSAGLDPINRKLSESVEVLSNTNMDVDDNDSDATVCCVCMDNHIDTVFCPCGHIVCCTQCSSELQLCPVCRADIKYAQHVFLPNALFLHKESSMSNTQEIEQAVN